VTRRRRRGDEERRERKQRRGGVRGHRHAKDHAERRRSFAAWRKGGTPAHMHRGYIYHTNETPFEVASFYRRK
jgi:hypothetical protein